MKENENTQDKTRNEDNVTETTPIPLFPDVKENDDDVLEIAKDDFEIDDDKIEILEPEPISKEHEQELDLITIIGSQGFDMLFEKLLFPMYRQKQTKKLIEENFETNTSYQKERFNHYANLKKTDYQASEKWNAFTNGLEKIEAEKENILLSFEEKDNLSQALKTFLKQNNMGKMPSWFGLASAVAMIGISRIGYFR